MLYSDEAFAGGLYQAKLNGNFGMKLHEHDKYNGSHRARKSYHFFNGTIVCLGTDIENKNEEFPTETTVFQLAATTPDMHDYWATYKSDGQTYIDPNGVGYYLSKNTMKAAKYERNFPQVTVGERSAKPTSGDWVSLTLQHGKAPEAASYEYAVLPHTDAASLKTFAKNPAYRVLQQDRNAHIVHSLTDNITSYVLFETPRSLPADGLLQKADTSCLVMVRENNGKLLLTVSQPDLALYRGSSDEAFDKDGKRIERSIYSRPWIDNDSGEIPVINPVKFQSPHEAAAQCFGRGTVTARIFSATLVDFASGCNGRLQFDVIRLCGGGQLMCKGVYLVPKLFAECGVGDLCIYGCSFKDGAGSFDFF